MARKSNANGRGGRLVICDCGILPRRAYLNLPCGGHHGLFFSKEGGVRIARRAAASGCVSSFNAVFIALEIDASDFLPATDVEIGFFLLKDTIKAVMRRCQRWEAAKRRGKAVNGQQLRPRKVLGMYCPVVCEFARVAPAHPWERGITFGEMRGAGAE